MYNHTEPRTEFLRFRTCSKLKIDIHVPKGLIYKAPSGKFCFSNNSGIKKKQNANIYSI